MKKNGIKKWNLIIVCMLALTSVSLASGYIPSSGDIRPHLPTPEPGQFMQNLIQSFRWIAMITAVIMLIVIGMKYAIASADEKASMKGTLVKVVIGCFVVIFANVAVDFILWVAGQ